MIERFNLVSDDLMQYKKNINNGDELSILDFGCMRLVKKGRVIDELRAIAQIHSAIDRGVNYFDKAYIYGNGKSETLLGVALSGGLREKIFQTQLKRLLTTWIDYYLIHMLADAATWGRLKSLGILEWLIEKKERGQIKNIGFSFHGGRAEFIDLIDAYDWDFCQVQYNYLDDICS